MSATPTERLAVLLMVGALVASGLAMSGGVFAQTTAGNDGAADNVTETPTAPETPMENETEAPMENETEAPMENETEAPMEGAPTVTTDLGEEIDRQELSYVRAVHASPDAPAVDVSVDNQTVLTGVEFGNVSDYLSMASGPHNVTISVAEDPDTVVFNETVTVDRRSITTIVASGAISENATQPFGVVAWPDDPWTPANNESAVSVAHLSPDTSTVDVTTNNGSVVLADDVSYQNASEYVTVRPGNYTVEVRDATGTNDGEIIATENVSLEPGTVSTAFAMGYQNAGEEPMDRPFELVPAQDATVSIHLPGQDTMADNETVEIDDLGENETDDLGENETDDLGENETDDLGENETDDFGENETDDLGEDDADDDAGALEQFPENDTDDDEAGLGADAGENETNATDEDDGDDFGDDGAPDDNDGDDGVFGEDPFGES